MTIPLLLLSKTTSKRFLVRKRRCHVIVWFMTSHGVQCCEFDRKYRKKLCLSGRITLPSYITMQIISFSSTTLNGTPLNHFSSNLVALALCFDSDLCRYIFHIEIPGLLDMLHEVSRKRDCGNFVHLSVHICLYICPSSNGSIMVWWHLFCLSGTLSVRQSGSPSVCTSIHRSICHSQFSALFSYILWHIELRFGIIMTFFFIYYRSSLIVITLHQVLKELCLVLNLDLFFDLEAKNSFFLLCCCWWSS